LQSVAGAFFSMKNQCCPQVAEPAVKSLPAWLQAALLFLIFGFLVSFWWFVIESVIA
jgi:hypothetical protein